MSNIKKIEEQEEVTMVTLTVDEEKSIATLELKLEIKDGQYVFTPESEDILSSIFYRMPDGSIDPYSHESALLKQSPPFAMCMQPASANVSFYSHRTIEEYITRVDTKYPNILRATEASQEKAALKEDKFGF